MSVSLCSTSLCSLFADRRGVVTSDRDPVDARSQRYVIQPDAIRRIRRSCATIAECKNREAEWNAPEQVTQRDQRLDRSDLHRGSSVIAFIVIRLTDIIVALRLINRLIKPRQARRVPPLLCHRYMNRGFKVRHQGCRGIDGQPALDASRSSSKNHVLTTSEYRRI